MRRLRHISLFFLLLGFFSSLSAEPTRSSLNSEILALVSKYQDFRNLGWSRRGTTALLQRVDGGPRGGYAIRFLIFDAVRDKNLFDQQIWQDELELSSGDPAASSEAIAASPQAAQFLEQWKSHGFPSTIRGTEIRKFPLSYGGSGYTAEIDFLSRKEMEDESLRYLGSIADFRVVVRKGSSKKQISIQRGIKLLDARVAGYFQSPLEPRILVVSNYTTRGFEGESDDHFFLSGCHLKSGFK